MFGFGNPKSRKPSDDQRLKQIEAQLKQTEGLRAQKEAIEARIKDYDTNFNGNIEKIEKYLNILEALPATAATTVSATSTALPATAATTVSAASTALPVAPATDVASAVSAASAEEALTAIVGDINYYTTKSPLAYLLKTNKELLNKAKSELQNIKSFTRKGPIQYSRDAKLSKKVSGGGIKTTRKRQVRSH